MKGAKIMNNLSQEIKQIPTEARRTYTVDEIANILSITRGTAYNLVKEGLFKSVRIGTSIRISKQSFDEWLDKQ